jgi:hypothetical protein
MKKCPEILCKFHKIAERQIMRNWRKFAQLAKIRTIWRKFAQLAKIRTIWSP